MNRSLLTLFFAATFGGSVLGEESKTKRIKFQPGKTEAVVTGKITGRNGVVYKLNARDGQFLQVKMLPGAKGADFNIFIPGRAPGDEALYNSSVGGRKYLGQLYKSGDHSILVYQNRAAARRGDVVEYKMLVRVTDKKPVKEEVPAKGKIPRKVIDDCLAKLRQQIPNKSMKVVTAKRGETSFIVDVRVEGVPKLWRCYHDSKTCTDTEYLGEG